MAWAELVVDRIVATGFIRPAVLWRGLQHCHPSPSRWEVSALISLSGLLVEPLAWMQSLLFAQRLQRVQLPDDPIVVIGHWRSGTTYLHQLLACDPTVATARNTLTVAPQVALLLKPWIAPLLKAWMTRVRPIDAVPWGPDDPQEDELGLARLTFDTNMGGMAFPRDYLANFRRHVLVTTRAYERQWLTFCRLTWLQPVPDPCTQVEETVTARAELLAAFESCRALIPAEQLLELDHDDLIRQPLQAVEGLYTHFGLTSWPDARGPIEARIHQAATYVADPVRLPLQAERRPQSLMEESA